MTETRWRVLLALIVVLTLARIAATHRVFSQTIDEGTHLAAGYDVITKRIFSTDPHHPPLAKALFALPFLNAPEPVSDGTISRGTVMLLQNDRYAENLFRARMPNLVFVAMAIIGVALWAKHLFTPVAGLLAALIFASLPPVLAHGGLATTDMALTATLIVSLYLFTLVLEDATWKRTIALGVAIALGLLSKYSFPVYFPPCALVLIAVRLRFPLVKLLCSAAIGAVLTFIAIPPQDFLAGIGSVAAQAVSPPKAILFDEVKAGGWWYYFPVALFFKTPIPFLILAIAGLRRKLEIALLAATILGIAMTSDINLGIRHLMPIYGPLSIAAAVAIRVRWLNALLIAWLVVSSAVAHPDYLAYFNEFAGKEPQRVLNDSNLDWGQDTLRLVRVAAEEKIPSITTAIVPSAPLDRIGLPPRKELVIGQPVQGWLAIGELNLALANAEERKWLDAVLGNRPYRRVGKSIRLYFLGVRRP